MLQLVPSCRCTSAIIIRAGDVVCLACSSPLVVKRAPAEHDTSVWLPSADSPLGNRTTLRLAREGVLESSKVGKRVLIKRASLEAYLSKHRREAPADEDLFGSKRAA